jgi:hypothetical protein
MSNSVVVALSIFSERLTLLADNSFSREAMVKESCSRSFFFSICCFFVDDSRLARFSWYLKVMELLNLSGRLEVGEVLLVP